MSRSRFIDMEDSFERAIRSSDDESDCEDSLVESSQKESEDQDNVTPISRNRKHTVKAFEVMNEMRSKSQLIDVTLVAGMLEIPAHKMVLAASSGYFLSMFTLFEECTKDRIQLLDFDPNALKLLVDYMYSSKILVNEENVQALLPAANVLQLTDVRDLCCEFLQTQLHPTNCLGIRAFADLHGCIILYEKSDDFIERNFEEVVQCEEFLALPSSQVVKLISKDNIYIPSEIVVYKCVKAWIEHDLSRREHSIELMGNVRFSHIPYSYLIQTVCSDLLLNSDVMCLNLTIDALCYQLMQTKSDTDIPFSVRNVRPRNPPTIPKIMLVIGGQAPKAIRSVEAYDFIADRWYKLEDMPHRKCRAGVSVLGGQVYIIGGFNGASRVCTVDMYDGVNNKWEVVNNMRTRRSTVGVAMLNGCIYAVGGFDGTTGLRTAEVYNPSTQEWSMITPMPTRRSSVGVGVLCGFLYVVGGYDGASRQCLKSVIRYNPFTESWTRVNDMSTCRSGAGIGVLDDILYAVGGHDGPVVRKTVEAYDPKTNTWSPVANMAVCRRNAGVVSFNNMLYVVGGDNGSRNLASVEFYNPKTNTWTMLPKRMSIGRSYAGVAVIDKPK